MSKVSNYLNEHVLGEVTSNPAIRQALSTDASILTITPDMVVYPRTTNDIRKVARFSNQLAEKGHVLPITVRGGGSDQTGAAIGKGIILSTTAHLTKIFECDAKQRLVRVQPGVNFQALNDTLALNGLTIPSAPLSARYSTIGGAIANNASGLKSGKYGATFDYVNQLEVVLSNGDILQTGRISKRELSRRKGMQTFEGEIYRQIDNILTDNAELIASLPTQSEERNNLGYAIADVKRKDGSIDLAPLFVGAQGTLGIVSEIIMKAAPQQTGEIVVGVAFDTWEKARDALDILRALDPSILELIDGGYYEQAAKIGKRIAFYEEAQKGGDVAAVVVACIDDPAERQRKKKAKKLQKLLAELATYIELEDGSDADHLYALRTVTYTAVNPDGETEMVPPSVDGAYIPAERFEDFMEALKILSSKIKQPLLVSGHALESVYSVRPVFRLHSVTDRQKLLAFADEYTKLVDSHSGYITAESAEGRLKSALAYKHLDDELKDLYRQIRDVFDPLGILNPGVKDQQTLKSLVPSVRKEYTLPMLAAYALMN